MKIDEKYRKDLCILAVANAKLTQLLQGLLGEKRFVVEVKFVDEAYYKSLCTLIEGILETPSFEGLYREYRRPFDTIGTESFCEDGDIEWENGIKQYLQEFQAKIETAIQEVGGPIKVTTKEIGKAAENVRLGNEAAFTVEFPGEEQVTINGHVLSRPHYESENHLVFKCIYNHPNEKIMVDEIKRALNIKVLKKKLERIILDLNFKGPLKHLFFPHISISAIYFRNPVRMKHLTTKGVSRQEIEVLL